MHEKLVYFLLHNTNTEKLPLEISEIVDKQDKKRKKKRWLVCLPQEKKQENWCTHDTMFPLRCQRYFVVMGTDCVENW